MDEEKRLERALLAKGWLTNGERIFLYWAAHDIGEHGSIVNIGTEYGASVVCFAEGARDSVTIVALDIDMSNWQHGDKYRNVVLKEIDSHIFGKAAGRDLEYPYLDVAFIDGDHSYNGVVRDLIFLPLVKTGRLAIFHDCYDWLTVPEKKVHQVCPGVNKAVQEWYDNSAGEWEELPHVDTMRVFRRI